MKVNKNIDKNTKREGNAREKTLISKITDNKLTALGALLFAVLLVLFVLIGVLLVRYESEQYGQQELENVQQVLDEMRVALKSRIYSNIYKTSAVKALVAMNPELTQDDFARAMEVQFREEHDLRNIGLARDMVLQFMYPIEGNEAAIGLDYRTLPDQLEAVELALRLNEIVLAGPLTLVQGGEGIIARIPIHSTDPASNREIFWGFASVVMNSDSIFAGAGIKENHDALNIAIRGRDALGAEGDVFWGDPLVFENNPVTHLIELPYGSWQIGAIPSTGWSTYSGLSTPLMWAYLVVAFIILAFTALIVFLLGKMDRTENERLLLTSSLEVFLKQTSDFVYYKDINSRFIFCSQTMADITNHKHWRDMIGKHDFDVFPHDTATVYNEEEIPVFEEGKPVLNKVNPYYNTDGEIGYFQTNKWPTFDDNNTVSGIFGISRDITAHKKAVEELEMERNLFAEGPIFNMEWEPETNGEWPIRYVSSNTEHILGYNPAEMLYREFSYKDIIHPDDSEFIINEIIHNIANHIDKFETSYRLKTKTGQYIWAYDFTVLVRNEEGSLTGIRSYMYDQSAQKKTEEALRNAEAKLEKMAYELTENIPVGTYSLVLPADGGWPKFEFLSSRFLELFGLTREEVEADSNKPFACVHPDDYDEFIALNARTFKEKSSFFSEMRLVIDGEVRWVTAESIARPLPDGTTVWEGAVVDITDRKQAEQELSESLRRFNDLVAHVSVGVYILWMRADGRMEFEYVSDEWCRMNQLRREDVLVDANLPIERIHPENREEVIRLNQQGAREHTKFYWEGRLLIDGEESFALIESTPVVFENGDIRWFGIQQDITERKRNQEQLEIAKAQADTANKAKSEFLANMSHEIRTPLNAIIGFGELLESEIEDETHQGYLKTINNASAGLLTLINDILDLSKIEAGEIELQYKPINISHVLKEIKAIFEQKTKSKNISFIADIQKGFPEYVVFDETRMRQIIINLVSNAVKFTDRGYIRISVKMTDPDKYDSDKINVMFSVEDTGIGIKDSDKAKIFEAFKQVSGQDVKKYGGTGLGLSITKKLAEVMNGKVSMQSSIGKGSVFTVEFCGIEVYAAQSLAEEIEDGSSTDYRFSNETVLVVDDVDTNLFLLEEMLSPKGLNVVTAVNGQDAYEKCLWLQPDLIITDLQMPVMDGYLFAEKLKSNALLSHIPILAVSASVQQENPTGNNIDEYLLKPVNIKELLRVIAKYIDKK